MARTSSEEGGGFSLWLSAELLPRGRRSFLTVVDDELTGRRALLPGEEVPPLSLLPAPWSRKMLCLFTSRRVEGDESGLRGATADPTAGPVLWAGDSATRVFRTQSESERAESSSRGRLSLGSCDSLVRGSPLGVVFLVRCADPRCPLQTLRPSGPVVGFLLLPLLLGEASGPLSLPLSSYSSACPPPWGQDTEKRGPCSGFRCGRWVVGGRAWMVLSARRDLQTQRWGAWPQSQGQAGPGHGQACHFQCRWQ